MHRRRQGGVQWVQVHPQGEKKFGIELWSYVVSASPRPRARRGEGRSHIFYWT